MKGLRHYYYLDDKFAFCPEYNMFYDAGDFFLRYTSQDVYLQWRQTLDRAVVDSRQATWWKTDKIWRYMYIDFTVTDEKMHGVSMFVPQNPAKGDYATYNEDIKQLAWRNAVN